MEPSKIPSLVVSMGKKLGATDISARVSIDYVSMIRFANNEITVSKWNTRTVASVFVAVEKKRATAEITNPSLVTLRQFMDRLVSTAKTSPEADVYAPLPKGPFKYNRSLAKPGRIDSSPGALVGHVEAAVNEALSQGAKRVAGSLVYRRSKLVAETSGGARGSCEHATIEISVRALANGDASGHFVSIAARDDDFKPEEAGRKAGEIARMAVNPVKGEPGKYETVLGPLTFAHIVEQVGDMASAFAVDAGLSFLTGKLGTRVASENLSLLDDPTLEGTYGAGPFDEEGLPTKKNIIIERGVLKTYLHNSTTAKKFGTESTANAGIISPHPFNLVVEAGDKGFDQLVSQVDNGLYITNDWYLRYQNYRTGDFSTIPRDGMFVVRRGSIEQAVKELRLSDNILRIISSIRALSKERYWIKWWEVNIPTLAPYALIEQVNFTSSAL